MIDNFINLRTMYFAVGLGNLLFALILVGMSGSISKNKPVLFWKWAKFLQGIAVVLFWLRGLIPDLLSIGLANIILPVGAILEFAATWTYNDHRNWKRVAFPMLAVLYPVFALVIATGQPVGYRISVSSVFITAVTLLISSSFLLPTARLTPLRLIIGGLESCLGLAFAWRAVDSFLFPQIDLFFANTAQMISFTFLYAFLIINGLGFFLLLQEDSDRALRDEIENHKATAADLIRAKETAEKANQAKSEFLANMSHELRTPMNAILGFSNLIRNEPNMTGRQKEYLDTVNQSGEHLLRLIDDVLDMAKIEAGYVDTSLEPIDLHVLVTSVSNLMRERAQRKKLKLVVSQSIDYPRYVMANTGTLRQIIINLVGNAIKFTDSGQVVLSLRSENSESGERLVIEVQDTGIGIRPEDHERIFDPFVQVNDSATPRKGTGLGLAITRRFVDMLGGAITVESNRGAGSRFRVELPIQRCERAEIDAVQHTASITALKPGQPEFRVLIVEDQIDNQVLLRLLLEKVGFRVEVAGNGSEALTMFQNWRPHFIWMDQRLPVMAGTEVTRRIRTSEGGSHVKIVALTASVFEDQRKEILESGADDLVRKPYRIDEIFDCMSRHLGCEFLSG